MIEEEKKGWNRAGLIGSVTPPQLLEITVKQNEYDLFSEHVTTVQL